MTTRRSVVVGATPGDADELLLRQTMASVEQNFKDLYAGGIDLPQGRLTLSSGNPVMTASVTGSINIYYTPYCGQLCPVYDGSDFNMVDTGGELTNVTTDATTNPAAVAVSSVYDLFVWKDANNVVRLSRGPAWTNATTRSMALARVRGILTNGAAITNGPAINRGTYVGTVASNGSSTIDFIFGTAASGGGMASLNVWNMYNRVSTITRVTDTAVAYTYTTATIRAANNSNTNRINYVIGVAEDMPYFVYKQIVTTAAAAGATCQTGIGDDSVTSFEIGGTYFAAQAAIAATGSMETVYAKGALETIIGAHYAQALELGDGTNANTFNVGTTGVLSGVLRL